jgi:hypothetical protein
VGFADLTFAGSAQLAFARAVEQAATDAHELRPEAWAIEDRQVVYSDEVEAPIAVLDGTKRLLAALALLAIGGEAALEVAMAERWIVRAAPPSISKELVVGDDDDEEGAGETIRTAS